MQNPLPKSEDPHPRTGADLVSGRDFCTQFLLSPAAARPDAPAPFHREETALYAKPAAKHSALPAFLPVCEARPKALQIPVFFPQHRRPLTAANAVPRGQTPEFPPAMLFLLSKTHESPQGMRFLFV